MTARRGMPPEFRALLERHARLGQLLPPLDDLDLTDPRERAELELILSEMEQVKAEIDAFLAAARAQS